MTKDDEDAYRGWCSEGNLNDIDNFYSKLLSNVPDTNSRNAIKSTQNERTKNICRNGHSS